MITFDSELLYVALDKKRRRAGMRWRDVATESGVDASTFSRMGIQYGSPSAENLAKMLVWLGTTDIRNFIKVDTDINVIVVPDAD